MFEFCGICYRCSMAFVGVQWHLLLLFSGVCWRSVAFVGVQWRLWHLLLHFSGVQWRLSFSETRSMVLLRKIRL